MAAHPERPTRKAPTRPPETRDPAFEHLLAYLNVANGFCSSIGHKHQCSACHASATTIAHIQIPIIGRLFMRDFIHTCFTNSFGQIEIIDWWLCIWIEIVAVIQLYGVINIMRSAEIMIILAFRIKRIAMIRIIGNAFADLDLITQGVMNVL